MGKRTLPGTSCPPLSAAPLFCSQSQWASLLSLLEGSLPPLMPCVMLSLKCLRQTKSQSINASFKTVSLLLLDNWSCRKWQTNSIIVYTLLLLCSGVREAYVSTVKTNDGSHKQELVFLNQTSVWFITCTHSDYNHMENYNQVQLDQL